MATTDATKVIVTKFRSGVINVRPSLTDPTKGSLKISDGKGHGMAVFLSKAEILQLVSALLDVAATLPEED